MSASTSGSKKVSKKDLILGTEGLLTWKKMTKLAISYMGFTRDKLEKIMRNNTKVENYNREVIGKWYDNPEHGDEDKVQVCLYFSLVLRFGPFHDFQLVRCRIYRASYGSFVSTYCMLKVSIGFTTL